LSKKKIHTTESETMKIKLRPSAASRWINCPASVKLCEGIPNSPAGEAAQIGTAIHAVAETCILTGVSPTDFIGKEVEGITITSINADFAQQHVNHIRDLELRLGTLKVEQYVTIYESDKVELGGTADVLAYSDEKDTLVIADLKTGRGYVDADSDQMKLYAIGAMRSLKAEFRNIELAIIQPHHGEPRTHKLTFKELNQWALENLTPALVAIADGTTTPTPSDKACQWCPAKATCPAHVETFNEVAAQPAMHTMTEDELAAMLAKVEMVEDYIKALRKYATERIEGGAIVRGWQMQPKRALRKWADEEKAYAVLLQAGLTTQQIYVQSMISPSEASKLLSKEDKALLDDITKKESSGLTLARAVGLAQ
jgi:hypothetical protein